MGRFVRQAMYHQLGRILILQPDEEHNFVCGEADHPMLPPGPNLYALRERHHLDHRLLKKAKLNKEPRAKTADHASSFLDELSAEDHQGSFRYTLLLPLLPGSYPNHRCWNPIHGPAIPECKFASIPCLWRLKTVQVTLLRSLHAPPLVPPLLSLKFHVRRSE